MIIRGKFSPVLHKNICCGYSLEVPCRGTSNEFPHMFLCRNKKNYPVIITKYSSLTTLWYYDNWNIEHWTCFMNTISPWSKADIPITRFKDSSILQAQTNDYNRLVSIPASTNSGVTTSGTDNPVDMFRNAVITLTTKGNVEEYIKPIVDILKRGVTDMAVLNEIIEVLYDHVCCFHLYQVRTWQITTLFSCPENCTSFKTFSDEQFPNIVNIHVIIWASEMMFDLPRCPTAAGQGICQTLVSFGNKFFIFRVPGRSLFRRGLVSGKANRNYMNISGKSAK